MTLRAVFQIGLHYAHRMPGFDPELSVEVYGNRIIVTLPGTSYSVTCVKPRAQLWCQGLRSDRGWLLPQRISRCRRE
jgi:hypothetical protein